MQIKAIIAIIIIGSSIGAADQNTTNQARALRLSVEDEELINQIVLPSPILPGRCYSPKSSTTWTASSTSVPRKNPKQANYDPENYDSKTSFTKLDHQSAHTAWLSPAQEEKQLATREAQLLALHRQKTVKKTPKTQSYRGVFGIAQALPRREGFLRRWLKKK